MKYAKTVHTSKSMAIKNGVAKKRRSLLSKKLPTKKEQMQMIGGLQMHIQFLENQLKSTEGVVVELVKFLGKEDEFDKYMSNRIKELEDEARANEGTDSEDNSTSSSEE